MKKRLVVGVLSAVLLVGGATSVFGASDSAKLEIKNLAQQMFSIQKQIVEKEVEAGYRTAEQADAMKKFIDQRQAATEQAIEEGKVISPGMGGKGMGMRGDTAMFNNGQPLTDEQLKTWSEAADARLAAQLEAMKSNGKLTDEQLKTWSDKAKAQLEAKKEALKNGTFMQGDMGMGKRGSHGGRAWGGKMAPSAPAPAATTSSTNLQ